MKNQTVGIIGVRGYPSFYGGFETAVRKLVPALIAEDWKVRVYSREIRKRVELENGMLTVCKALGIDTKNFSTLTHGFTSTLHMFLFKVDVALILNVGNCFWLPLLRLRKIPIIVNVDGLEWERLKWGKVARKFLHLGARFAARFADELIFDSVEIARYWKKNFSREGTYIPYGGTLRIAGSVQPSRKNPYLLVVSRLVPENSIEEFLEASIEIQKFIPIIIVGNATSDSKYIYRILELTKTYPNIQWLGQVTDDRTLLKLWDECTLYFHGHTVGGTNPALVQAMSSACAIIAVDTVFNREVLRSSAYLCKATANAISDAVTFLLKSPQNLLSMRNQAFEEAKSRFSWDLVNQKYIELLSHTIEIKTKKNDKSNCV